MNQSPSLDEAVRLFRAFVGRTKTIRGRTVATDMIFLRLGIDGEGRMEAMLEPSRGTPSERLNQALEGVVPLDSYLEFRDTGQMLAILRGEEQPQWLFLDE